MTFLEIANLDLLGKRIYLKKGNESHLTYFIINILGVIKHQDDFYFITKSTDVNNLNESVVRQVKVSSVLNGLTTGKYVKELPRCDCGVKSSKFIDSTNNSYYKKGVAYGLYIAEEGEGFGAGY